MLTYSIALQRGSVTQATAPLVVGETVAPALVGLLLLGDHARPGWGWVAAVGFVLSVAGAVSLARHGEIEPEPSPARRLPMTTGTRPEVGCLFAFACARGELNPHVLSDTRT